MDEAKIEETKQEGNAITLMSLTFYVGKTI